VQSSHAVIFDGVSRRSAMDEPLSIAGQNGFRHDAGASVPL